MKFKIISAIVFIVFILICMASCNIIKNSGSTEGEPQTEQVQPQ